MELEYVNDPLILKQNIFKSAIQQILFATSTQESRPVLTGVNFKIVDNLFECTATDSYRLAKRKINLNSTFNNNVDIIVPAKNLNEVIRMIVDDNKNVELHIFVNKIIFKFGSLIIMSRLINGTFAKTSNLLPKGGMLTVSTSWSAFYDVIDRVSILTSDKEKNIVTLETKDDYLILRSSSSEIGKVDEKMPITKDNKENIKISFSAKYMMEALKSFSTESVDIHFIGEIKPILIKSNEDETLTQLVLPIRTY